MTAADPASDSSLAKPRSIALLLAAAAVVVLMAIVLAASRGSMPGGSVPASPVKGVVISVDSAGLADVRGFELRTSEGQVLAFSVGSLENGAEFPPGHLAEHVATSQPVRVFFRTAGAELVAYRIEDAG